ncbi:hypothetical protein [Kroppenstedtia pulmonis]|nr:hypothetical protein [Kroppenstedtia pulmonis]
MYHHDFELSMYAKQRQQELLKEAFSPKRMRPSIFHRICSRFRRR